jgi:hypothetical protein
MKGCDHGAGSLEEANRDKDPEQDLPTGLKLSNPSIYLRLWISQKSRVWLTDWTTNLHSLD